MHVASFLKGFQLPKFVSDLRVHRSLNSKDIRLGVKSLN